MGVKLARRSTAGRETTERKTPHSFVASASPPLIFTVPDGRWCSSGNVNSRPLLLLKKGRMSSHGFTHSGSNNNENEPITPRRLELSLNPSDGSLLTAPLTQVLLSATDSLYSDLYNMAHGELDVTTAALQPDADTTTAQQQQHEEENVVPMQQTKRERMSNLSFAQRRHELAWRLAQHGKSLQHVAGLTAAAASSHLSNSVAVSSTALQHARTAWVQADEAQDALYFFHAQLFPARAAPHDVYGALDVLLAGRWFDLPTRLRLTVDRYDASRENEYSRQEVDERWQVAVRDKLLRGELGWMRKQQQQPQSKQPLWKVSLRGGIVKLTKGKPKTLGHQSTRSYPIEALLTVLSTSLHPEWTLLSIEVQVHAKTGEFNHQLETSNRQRYDLHRLCALAMSREEARARQVRQHQAEEKDTEKASCSIARPLHMLFQVAHVFSLSWQLEMLSAQAQALRRGVWAAGESNPLMVTPVRFFHNTKDILGVVSVSFWRVDDAYGPPSMGDLSLDESQETESGRKNYAATTSQLTLSIRAEADAGIKVSLSGAESIMSVVSTQPHVRSTIENLLEAASDPFALSMSDALLAATMLCAERKCHAVVSALQPVDRQSVLPEWILLKVERGSVAVAARISYHGLGAETQQSGIPILFRVMCDARTGSFVCTFPRSTQLLGQLAGNVVQASESLALRIGSLPQNRRRAAAANSSVRVVRDAFDGLIRSINLLGQRTGVGNAWENVHGQSALLRERAIQSACTDVRVSLMKCCGMAALYGLAPLSIGGAVGLDASPDQ